MAARAGRTTGPAHSHWILRGTSQRFAEELRQLGLRTTYRAYADRRSVGADPDFFGDKVPPDAIETLLSPKYLAERKPSIALDKATPSKDLSSPPLAGHESPETTHFSVVDADGDRVRDAPA